MWSILESITRMDEDIPRDDSMLSRLSSRYVDAFSAPGYILSLLLSLLALCVSLAASSIAVVFSSRWASNGVTDLILSNTPAFDVGQIYVYGAFLLIAFIALLCFAYPKRAPFTLFALSLFFIIRALFVTLTHLGPFALQAPVDFGVTVQRMFFGDDYFFSGHTGSPFLMALVYWENRTLRYLFLAWSVFFGAVVLLGHLHYSIDVFAAFFITFSIYHIAVYLFPRAYAMSAGD